MNKIHKHLAKLYKKKVNIPISTEEKCTGHHCRQIEIKTGMEGLLQTTLWHKIENLNEMDKYL